MSRPAPVSSHAAQRYVLQAHDDPSKWRVDDGFILYHPTFAAYRALLLLLYNDQAALTSLPAEVWGRWAAIIVGYPVFGGTTDEAPHPVLTALAYLLAPQETTAALIYEIDKDNRNGHSPSMLWKFERCWDDALASALLDKAHDPVLKAGSLNAILRALFEHQPSAELYTFTASLVVQPVPQDEDLHRKENTCQHGLYLVGWFNCAAWDNNDYRKHDAQSLAPSLEQAHAQFEEQAQALTGGGRTIRSCILNAALPENNALLPPGDQNPQRRRQRRRQARHNSDDRYENRDS